MYGIEKAIIELEKDEMIDRQIDEKSFPIEYYFTIHNYKGDLINEVDFDYQIEITLSNNDFPVNCTLWDCDYQMYIDLVNGKSETMKLAQFVKESRRFKLSLQWQELEGELAETVEINLKIKAMQPKKGAVDEISKSNNRRFNCLDNIS